MKEIYYSGIKFSEPSEINDQKKQDKCHSTVMFMVKKGTLIKQPCEICKNDKVDAHHEDYSEPLIIRWLCHKHHLIIHSLFRMKEDRRLS